MKVSVIIVTRNRAADLAGTLNALRAAVVPDGLQAELLVVDNGSTDNTAEVARSFAHPSFTVRYVFESHRGAARARNRGLEETAGELILFTDDDVRVPPGWLAGMCEPILQRKATVVADGVRLAPNLVRDWMTSRHRSYLAATEWLNPERPHSLVGANMAFSRDVLRRVPGFDPELGPGALGFGEEELFSAQLLKAGYPIFGRLDVWVEHHFDPSRLLRASWLETAERRGRVNAYLTYHWHSRGYRLARLRLAVAAAKLTAHRTLSGQPPEEGCSERELQLRFQVGELKQYEIERRRTRNYELHGLVKQREAR
jgi:glycosyltransferase involved in cell wall biosynthesis